MCLTHFFSNSVSGNFTISASVWYRLCDQFGKRHFKYLQWPGTFSLRQRFDSAIKVLWVYTKQITTRSLCKRHLKCKPFEKCSNKIRWIKTKNAMKHILPQSIIAIRTKKSLCFCAHTRASRWSNRTLESFDQMISRIYAKIT